MTNQSLFTGNPNSWVVYDIHAGETGLPLAYPLPAPSRPLGLCAALLLLTTLRRRGTSRKPRS